MTGIKKRGRKSWERAYKGKSIGFTTDTHSLLYFLFLEGRFGAGTSMPIKVINEERGSERARTRVGRARVRERELERAERARARARERERERERES
jgi:hypothetical protein